MSIQAFALVAVVEAPQASFGKCDLSCVCHIQRMQSWQKHVTVLYLLIGHKTQSSPLLLPVSVHFVFYQSAVMRGRL